MDLVKKALAGDRRALARLLSLVEDDGPQAREALRALHPHTGRAHIVGVTGAPGTGKSTLVNELAKTLRAQGVTVGIIAVDPTSPFTGGAILGDRVRMRDLAGDPGIFIRSMATRGSLGGLARATGDAVKVLDAVGFQTVLVETVGVGQAEVDVARTAHTVVVVEAPGLGDDVQALKAGLLEIADVLVVNKADRPGADQTARALEVTLDLGRNSTGGIDGWRPPIIKTVALNGTGVKAVAEAIGAHRAYLQRSGLWDRRERERIRADLIRALEEALLGRLLERVGEEELNRWVECIAAREADVYAAVESLVGPRERAHASG
ncbi:MAG TPA: methylmalonyl Co-A mutase-associated GTPase MeaB [Anaerolineales bacterium]|nr:methylmalonyl Co-A mutase-associated GTPase MeaB [Anaerolineae bacterium]HIP86847.1 methylmalonyl Co-A mutase-associated GTPase MeaB [Anaerolineales bacterium]